VCPLRGVDLAADNPGVLAHLSSPGEPILLEQLDGGAEQEPALSLPSGRHLRDCLDQTAAGGCDLGERTLQPGTRDSAATVALVDEDAGDPPVRTRRRVFRVLAVVLQSEFLRAAVLTPTLRQRVLVEDKRSTGTARPDQLLLQRAWIADAALILDVMDNAPAPSVDTVVALDQLREGIPRGSVERAGLVGRRLTGSAPSDVCIGRLAIRGFSRERSASGRERGREEPSARVTFPNTGPGGAPLPNCGVAVMPD
jgi:hypothetical protein